jgi:disulfide bond formation protein DsbB
MAPASAGSHAWEERFMRFFSYSDFFRDTTLYIALAIAWTAMLGSLYFSEVMGFLPCDLCWYQRILMYPLVGITAIGLLRVDPNLPYFILPFSLFGQGISTYHYLLEKTNIFGAPTACRSGIPCTTAWINWFGFMTIPFLAMVAFFLITAMTLIAITVDEPDDLGHRFTPWGPVVTVFAVVVVAFSGMHFWRTGGLDFSRPTTAGVQRSLVTSAGISPSTVATPAASILPDAAAGERLYAEACALCHGQDANGVPNLGTSLVASTVIDASDQEALAVIKQGIGLDDPRNTTGLVMPPNGGRPDLTDNQLLEIIHYLRAKE